MVESLRLRGRYVDMQLHDDLDDSWMLMRAGTKEVLVIGSRTQIMNVYLDYCLSTLMSYHLLYHLG